MHYKYVWKARGKTTKGEKNRKRGKEGMHGKIEFCGMMMFPNFGLYFNMALTEEIQTTKRVPFC